MSPKLALAGALLAAVSLGAHAEEAFPWEGAKKTLSEYLAKHGGSRRSTAIGYQLETPVKANIVIHVESAGTIFQPAYKLTNTAGATKWYLVFPGKGDQPPMPIE